MCGICLSEAPIEEKTKTLIKNRGREFYNEIQQNDLFIVSSVLSIRSLVSQPICGNGFVLQYNGEIYNDSESDTNFIKEMIVEAIHNNIANQEDSCIEDWFKTLSEIHTKINIFENETAIVISNKNYVMFFKDDIGKRSLGYSVNPFTVSSVRYTTEIDPMKLYIYDLKKRSVHWRFKYEEGIVKRYFQRIDSIRNFLSSEKYSKEYSFLDGYDFIPKIEGSPGTFEQPNVSEVEILHELMIRSFDLRKFEGNPIVFFSGGIDSLIVAIYIHLVFDLKYKIILINTGIPESFDRKFGLESYDDLKNMFPNRNFEFIENDISIESIIENKERIEMILHPKNSKMSFNIASVIYFSAKCAASHGKIVYLGSGADELFGGYNKYNSETGNVRDNMLFDLFTISTHNICRDDRMIGEWSLEARFPFLDYKIVDFSLDLSTNSLIREAGYNKAILRDLLNYHRFYRASGVPKKAMQYGSGMSNFESQLNKQRIN